MSSAEFKKMIFPTPKALAEFFSQFLNENLATFTQTFETCSVFDELYQIKVAQNY